MAMSSSGPFAVAWDGRGLLGLFPGVYVQRFAADGTPVGGEIGVAGSLLLDVRNASIGMASNGDFVVVYEATDALLSRGVFARRYNADGTAKGAAFRVNPATTGEQTSPRVSVREDGSFVVSWEGSGSGDTSGVFVRAYDSAGTDTTGEVRANETTAGSQSEPIVAVMSSGFAVAWSGNGPGDAQGVYLRVFDASGAALTGEVPVNTELGGAQTGPSLGVDGDDEVVVAWSGEGTGDTSGVYWRPFWPDGTPQSDQRLANLTTTGNQAAPSVSGTGSGRYAVVWSGDGAGDDSGVFGLTLSNDAPVSVWSVGVVSYTEGDGWLVLDPGVSLSDPDGLTLSWATVRISSGLSSSEDELRVSSPGALAWSYDALTGTLTLSGVGTISAYEDALRSVAYRNTSEQPSPLARTLSLRANDGVDDGVEDTLDLGVTPVNDAPVSVWSVGVVSYTEGDGWLVLDPGVSLSDPDGLTLSWATVRISSGLSSSEDELRVSSPGALAWSYDALTGTLTLSGVGTISAYEDALRSVAYRNTSEQPSPLARTLSLRANDGVDDGVEDTLDLGVTPVNDAPVLEPGATAAVLGEDESLIMPLVGLMISNPESLPLVEAVIEFLGASWPPSVEVTLDVLGSGLTSTWDGALGRLVITGVGTADTYEDTIASLVLRRLGLLADDMDFTIVLHIADQAGSSDSANIDLTIQATTDNSSTDNPPDEEPSTDNPPVDGPPFIDPPTDNPPDEEPSTGVQRRDGASDSNGGPSVAGGIRSHQDEVPGSPQVPIDVPERNGVGVPSDSVDGSDESGSAEVDAPTPDQAGPTGPRSRDLDWPGNDGRDEPLVPPPAEQPESLPQSEGTTEDSGGAAVEASDGTDAAAKAADGVHVLLVSTPSDVGPVWIAGMTPNLQELGDLMEQVFGADGARVIVLVASTTATAVSLFAGWLVVGAIASNGAARGLNELHGLDLVALLKEWERASNHAHETMARDAA
ncbi:MAG: hypothetical protein RBS39_06445 [Phycisphaerales bacterium]|nr:hypothetical protein [Phycisphaerales bacterium]